MLQAQNSHAVGGAQSADIIVQAESGATTTKTITVDFGQVGFDYPVEDINDFEPNYRVETKVRKLGTSDWKTAVDAEIGETVEFQIEYKNNSNKGEWQNNVMIRNVIPASLQYVAGTTKLYNGLHNGDVIDQDAITTTGINIGNYAPGVNAYIRFRATVVKDNLACGPNMLVSWGQAGVGDVTLQDYAAVFVNKS